MTEGELEIRQVYDADCTAETTPDQIAAGRAELRAEVQAAKGH